MASMTPRSSNFDSYVKGKAPALGIDLGGTKLSAALVLDGAVKSDLVTVATPYGPDKIIKAILELIALFQDKSILTGVGIATAGVVDCRTGNIIGSTPNIPGWTGTPLKKIIEQKTMLPVHVDNDGNAATYGDAHAMGLKEKACVVGITIGTGIGGGLLIYGRPYRGANWAAGEVGHLRISIDNKRLCTCGMFDCWEEYGAGRGLIGTCKELLAGISPDQSELAASIDELTTRMITDAASKNDMVACKAMNIWHSHLAAGMVNIAHILNPDCFVVSGGMSNVIDFEMLSELVKDRCLSTIGENLSIKKSQLGSFAGIIGAAQVVLDDVMPAEH
ncbi:MAG: ROK family protein [Candidatus Obscuribacterales bacterium]|nr:ROK family protein [Candidatus Obscuribacterales bacterium]